MQTDKIHELSEKLTLLHEVYSRRISDRALLLWVEKLTPLIGPELDRVLEESLTQKAMPTLGDLLEMTRASIRRNQRPAVLTDEEPEDGSQVFTQARAKAFFAEVRKLLGDDFFVV